MGLPGNRLTVTDEVNEGDKIPAWTANESDWRGIPASVLKAYVLDSIVLDDMVTQYSSPVAGSSVSYTLVGDKSWWLVITPTGAVASYSIVFPYYTLLADKQELLVNTTQELTVFGYGSGGASIVGAPNTMAAGSSFRMRYDAALNTWYRVSDIAEASAATDRFVSPTGAVTLTADDSGKAYDTASTSRAFTVNAGYGSSFAEVTVNGPCSWVAGGGVTLTDNRSAGAGYHYCQLVHVAPNVFRVLGVTL